MIRVRRPSQILAAAAACAMLAACTNVVSGSATKGAGELPAGSVDVLRLSPGNYPTTPAKPLGAAGSPERGTYLEGARMAEVVLGPWEVDPAYSGPGQAAIYPSAGSLRMLFLGEGGRIAADHGYVTGFGSSRSTTDGSGSLLVAAFRYPDEAAAAAAAEAFHHLQLHPADDLLPPGDPVAVPDRPRALVSAKGIRSLQGDAILDETVNAFEPQGALVLYAYAKVTGDRQAAVDAAVAALRKQTDKLAGFEPTPVDQLPDLPADPTGLLARTLPAELDSTNNGGPGLSNATYPGTTGLLWQRYPVETGRVWEKVGVDVRAEGAVAVTRTRDADAAAELLDYELEVADRSGEFRPADPVPHLPGSHCYTVKQLSWTGFTCFATADQYLIEAVSPQLADVHQRTAAQYLMLTAP